MPQECQYIDVVATQHEMVREQRHVKHGSKASLACKVRLSWPVSRTGLVISLVAKWLLRALTLMTRNGEYGEHRKRSRRSN